MQVNSISTAEYKRDQLEGRTALAGGALAGLLAKEVIPVSKDANIETVMCSLSKDVLTKADEFKKAVDASSPENAKALSKAFKASVKDATRPTSLFVALGAGTALSIVTIKNSLQSTERFYIDALREEQGREFSILA